MRIVCVALLLIVLGPRQTAAQRLDEQLRLEDLLEEEVPGLGWVQLSGTVRNVGEQAVNNPYIVFTLKSGTKIVGREQALIEGSTEDWLYPGETGVFDVYAQNAKSEYTEIEHFFRAYGQHLDPSLLTGEVVVNTTSANLRDLGSGYTMLYAELENRTNAIIGDVSIHVVFYDADGAFLDRDDIPYGLPDELYPDQVVSFEGLCEAAFERVARWEITWEFTPLRLGEGVATVVEDGTWGAVKTWF